MLAFYRYEWGRIMTIWSRIKSWSQNTISSHTDPPRHPSLGVGQGRPCGPDLPHLDQVPTEQAVTAQEREVIQASWTRMVSRPEDPELPFTHEACRDKSASHVFKNRRVSIQRILLHMFESRLPKRSATEVCDHKRAGGAPFLPPPFCVAPFYPRASSLRERHTLHMG